MRFFWLILLLLVLPARPTQAARRPPHLAWALRVGPVARTGFYRVPVPPALLGRLRPDHGDLRLYGGPRPKDPEVPYLFSAVPDSATDAAWEVVSAVRLMPRDSAAGTLTLLTLRLAGPRLVERLVVDVAGPARFYRTVEVLRPNPDRPHHRRERRYWTPWLPTWAGVLRSDSATGRTLDLGPNLTADSVLRVLIRNADDAPLRVTAVRAEAHPRYLTAYLRAGQHYELRGGHPTLPAPTYDLAYFRADVPGHLPTAPTGTVLRRPSPPHAAGVGRWALWLVLGGVGVLLAWLAARLMVEIKLRG